MVQTPQPELQPLLSDERPLLHLPTSVMPCAVAAGTFLLVWWVSLAHSFLSVTDVGSTSVTDQPRCFCSFSIPWESIGICFCLTKVIPCYVVLLFCGSWALAWCSLLFSLCDVLVYVRLVYSLRAISLREFLNFCVKYLADRAEAQSWQAVLLWWLQHQRSSMMLESCNFPLLVNSVTPLKKKTTCNRGFY